MGDFEQFQQCTNMVKILWPPFWEQIRVKKDWKYGDESESIGRYIEGEMPKMLATGMKRNVCILEKPRSKN